jgi:hypothetical protein
MSIVTDEESKQEIIWGMAFYLENSLDFDDKIRKLVNRKAYPFLIKGLKLKSKHTIRPILRCLVHASYSSVTESLKYFDYDLLKEIASLLKTETLTWVHDVCWLFLNLIVHSSYDFYHKLFEPEIIEDLIRWILNKRCQIVVRSAVWTMGAFIRKGNQSRIEALIVNFKIIDVLMAALQFGSEDVVIEILSCLEHLLEFSRGFDPDGENLVADLISRNEYFGFFIELQMVNNRDIYHKLVDLLSKYFHGIIED